MRIESIEQLHEGLRQLIRVVVEAAAGDGIPVYAAYGTALGAVRHSDIIPWDSDADLHVHHADIERLLAAIERHPSVNASNLVVLRPRPGSRYEHLFPRVAFANVDYNFVHVDIFPIVGANGVYSARARLASARLIRKTHFLKHFDASSKEYLKIHKRMIYFALRGLLMIVPSGLLPRLFRRLSNRVVGDSKFLVSICGSYGAKEIFPAEFFGLPRSLAFGEGTVGVPSSIDSYLDQLYGDYMKIPDQSHRSRALQHIRDVILPAVNR